MAMSERFKASESSCHVMPFISEFKFANSNITSNELNYLARYDFLSVLVLEEMFNAKW
jgi:hypothetical protein